MDIITEATIKGRRELERSDMVREFFHARRTEKAKSFPPHARWAMLRLLGHDGSYLAILCFD
ncbi:hypothetical protein [Telmatospirillum sp.]|uniref:hypothetical protein n=1 Tax=Telmatospirillum sp. TaxID=2079197 RepID=UPI002852569B|nr:hypothetical protein [Telmatospirillum sp.]